MPTSIFWLNQNSVHLKKNGAPDVHTYDYALKFSILQQNPSLKHQTSNFICILPSSWFISLGASFRVNRGWQWVPLKWAYLILDSHLLYFKEWLVHPSSTYFTPSGASLCGETVTICLRDDRYCKVALFSPSSNEESCFSHAHGSQTESTEEDAVCRSGYCILLDVHFFLL